MILFFQEVVKNVSSGHGGSHLNWDWQIPVYLFLGGIVAGLMILSGLKAVRKSTLEKSEQFRLVSWLVPVILSAGMLALFLDITNKLNVLRFYFAFKPEAPMSWGSWILILVYPVSILFALSELPQKWRGKLSSSGPGKILVDLAVWSEKEAVKKVLSWGSIALGVSMGIYTGILLSNFNSTPLWNSAILGPLFLTSGLSTGAAFILLFGISPEERKELGRLDLIFIIVEIALITLFIISLTNGREAQQEAVGYLVGGQFTAAFWSLVVIAGLLVPLVLEAFEAIGRNHSRWLAPSLVLVGGLALRWILVFAGQISVL